NLGRLAEPTIPVQIALVRIRVDGISPFAVLGIVSTIGTLSPNKGSESAGLDPLGGFVKHRIRTVLRSDLKDLTRPFHCIVNPEPFVEIASQRFLALHMFAGLHRVN